MDVQVKEFDVSNDVLDDVEEMRRRIAEDGYLFFRDLLPLADCPRELGGLALMPGSNKGGIRQDADNIDHEKLTGEWLSTDYRTGDLLVFHSGTAHKGLPNLTPDRLCMSVDFRYSGVSSPKVAKEFMPHGDQPSWEEVYAGWQSTDTQCYWKKHDLNIVPLDRDYMANRDAKTFELTQKGDETARPALIRIANQEADPENRKTAEEALRELDKLAGKPS